MNLPLATGHKNYYKDAHHEERSKSVLIVNVCSSYLKIIDMTFEIVKEYKN
jgi:hypothetical protein